MRPLAALVSLSRCSSWPRWAAISSLRAAGSGVARIARTSSTGMSSARNLRITWGDRHLRLRVVAARGRRAEMAREARLPRPSSLDHQRSDDTERPSRTANGAAVRPLLLHCATVPVHHDLVRLARAMRAIWAANTSCRWLCSQPAGVHATEAIQFSTRNALNTSKCLTFAVTSVASWTAAIAAICPSTWAVGLPRAASRARSVACQRAARSP